MVYTCFLCKWRSDKHPRRSYHKFPSNDELKQKWLDILGKSKVRIGTRTTLCSLHFEEDCFRYGLVNGRKILKDGSFPTLHLIKCSSEDETIDSVDGKQLPEFLMESNSHTPHATPDDVQMNNQTVEFNIEDSWIKISTSELHHGNVDEKVEVQMEICSSKGSSKERLLQEKAKSRDIGIDNTSKKRKLDTDIAQPGTSAEPIDREPVLTVMENVSLCENQVQLNESTKSMSSIDRDNEVALVLNDTNAEKQQFSKRQPKLQNAGASLSSDDKNEANSSKKENQELCLQIKNSLKALRRQSVPPVDESNKSEKDIKEESPFLNLEVFTDEPESSVSLEVNPDEKFKSPKEPSTEFYDESQPEKQTTPLKKEIRTKPVKRNPRRKVVIQNQLKKDLIEARKAPALEKIYLNTGKSPQEIKTHPAKRRREQTSDPSHFDHKEQLYEYGKYVAEQMMCFDEKDFLDAQAEINEVLSKYRLKYKILNCLSKPSNGNKSFKQKHSNKVTRPATQKKSAGSVNKIASNVKSTEQDTKSSVPEAVPLVAKPVLPQLVSVVPSIKELGVLNMTPSSSASQIGFVIVPNSIGEGFNLVKQHINSSGSLVTQPLQGKSCETSVPQPGLSQLISTGTSVTLSGPSLVIPARPSMSQAKSIVIPLGSTLTDTVSLLRNSLESAVTPGPSRFISAGTLIQPRISGMSVGTPQQVNRCESSVIQPEFSGVDILESPVVQHNLLQKTSTESSEIRPVISETPESQLLRPPFLDVIPITAEPDTLIVKVEPDSDEEK